MKPTVLFATTLLLFVSVFAVGQHRVLYHENTFERTFTKCQKPPSFGVENVDLQKYLTDKLQAQIPTTGGHITMSVLIDTTGKPLCEWIENNSNLDMDGVKLDQIIDQMPNWHCGLQNGYKVNCAEFVELTFSKRGLIVFYRLG